MCLSGKDEAAVGCSLRGGLADWYRAAWLEFCAKKIPFLVVSLNHSTTEELYVAFTSMVLAQVALWRPFWVYWGASKDNRNEIQLVESDGSVSFSAV